MSSPHEPKSKRPKAGIDKPMALGHRIAKHGPEAKPKTSGGRPRKSPEEVLNTRFVLRLKQNEVEVLRKIADRFHVDSRMEMGRRCLRFGLEVFSNMTESEYAFIGELAASMDEGNKGELVRRLLVLGYQSLNKSKKSSSKRPFSK